jgi:SSS family solute:Na+ symporter
MFTVVMVALGILWVPFIQYLSTEVYIYLQSVQAYISPPIAAVFLLGGRLAARQSPRRDRRAGLGGESSAPRASSSSSVRTNALAQAPLIAPMVSMNFLHFAILLFAISVVLLVVVSLATDPVTLAQLRGLTFKTLGSSYIPHAERSQRLFRITWSAPSSWRCSCRVVGVLRVGANESV